jgi:hypothetical protein
MGGAHPSIRTKASNELKREDGTPQGTTSKLNIPALAVLNKERHNIKDGNESDFREHCTSF